MVKTEYKTYGSRGGRELITYTSNIKSIQSDEYWLDYAYEGDTILFHLGINPTTSERTGTITVITESSGTFIYECTLSGQEIGYIFLYGYLSLKSIDYKGGHIKIFCYSLNVNNIQLITDLESDVTLSGDYYITIPTNKEGATYTVYFQGVDVNGTTVYSDRLTITQEEYTAPEAYLQISTLYTLVSYTGGTLVITVNSLNVTDIKGYCDKGHILNNSGWKFVIPENTSGATYTVYFTGTDTEGNSVTSNTLTITLNKYVKQEVTPTEDPIDIVDHIYYGYSNSFPDYVTVIGSNLLDATAQTITLDTNKKYQFVAIPNNLELTKWVDIFGINNIYQFSNNSDFSCTTISLNNSNYNLYTYGCSTLPANSKVTVTIIV